MKTEIMIAAGIAAALCCSCDYMKEVEQASVTRSTLSEVAGMLSALPLEQEHLDEVFDAVDASAGNGYDEEYTMSNVFLNPGGGVGDEPSKASSRRYARPLRELISDYLKAEAMTKAGGDPEGRISRLAVSDCQIFWPYHERWDGHTMPIITFDPGNESSVNEGYELVVSDDGSRKVEKVMVDEATAMNRPVWVVNTNDDSAYTSLEMLRRRDPGYGGDEVIVRPVTKASGDDIRTLVLKDFIMNRNFDTWFRGASEFFVKVGGVDGFKAKTEDDMRLYQPSVTDFMIVVKRNQKGVTVPFNAILISEWTDQMEELAFLITEDDGGTVTNWKASAVVKVNSKSYGIELDIPYRDKDDIVWRGSLSSKFVEKYAGQVQHFGDVDLTFDFI